MQTELFYRGTMTALWAVGTKECGRRLDPEYRQNSRLWVCHLPLSYVQVAAGSVGAETEI